MDIMGRKRSNDPFRGITLDKRWKWWIYRPYLGRGKRGKPVKLAPEGAADSEILAAKERYLNPPVTTFRRLSADYIQSGEFKQKAPSTQKEYVKYHNQLCALKMTDGYVLGDYDHDEVTTPMLRNYMDSFIGGDGGLLDGAVLANRQISYITTVYRWGKQRGKCKENPAKDIDKHTEKHRDYYVTNAEYLFAAYLPGPQQMALCLELAYLCRLRANEVFNLVEAQIIDVGIHVNRLKGSKSQIIGWTPRLRHVVDQCLCLPGPSFIDKNAAPLVHMNGKKIKYEWYKTEWRRKYRPYLIGGNWSIHDLKHKGVTDFEGDKHKATGDWSPNMVKVYNQEIEVVGATK